ncbi:Rpn family recombination-promoting nuclease/putative transposase [Ihubacter massiliensis]|nr:Rpn family recombination-promoting nuclease/putative transposase [Ihubacter massiliensis]MCO7120500.1 Rpn family recombination-promoting nuclease/putative transposase [Ihubacter massiliensis]MDE8734727.1 Rpn family recombination-promoting nuclease/putative transposase [Eubacteriales bacterium DFI.9.88]
MKKAKQTYKDSVFRKLFHDKEKILELYNALSGRNYSSDTEIQIVTLEDVIFGDRKNDLAFIIDGRLIILIEHQSTINPNMPLRMLVYIAKEYEKFYFSKAIYSKQLVKIPTPELYVFYNGKEDLPLEENLKLSDAFLEKCATLSVEAVVKVINVNYKQGAEILERCKVLNEYSRFIYLVRKNWEKTNDLEAAIKQSIDTCIKEGVLRDFLKKNGGDVMSFLYDELSREECETIREQDGYQKGLSEGIDKGIKQGIEQGIEQGIAALIELCQDMELSRAETKARIVRKFSLSEEKAESYMQQYWK